MKHEQIYDLCVELAGTAELVLAETRSGVRDTGESELSAQRARDQAVRRIAQSEYEEGHTPWPMPLRMGDAGWNPPPETLHAAGWHQIETIHNLADLELHTDWCEIPNTWYSIFRRPDRDGGFTYWMKKFTDQPYPTWQKPPASN